MQQDTSPKPDWYDDPENPGGLRYWDGSSWTEKKAARGKPPKQKRPGFVNDDGTTSRSFGLIVTIVLAVAVCVITALAAGVVWIDSYNTGHSRGEHARDNGVKPSEASQYCHDKAKATSGVGSAEGSWDIPWVIGCKRAID